MGIEKGWKNWEQAVPGKKECKRGRWYFGGQDCENLLLRNEKGGQGTISLFMSKNVRGWRRLLFGHALKLWEER